MENPYYNRIISCGYFPRKSSPHPRAESPRQRELFYGYNGSGFLSIEVIQCGITYVSYDGILHLPYGVYSDVSATKTMTDWHMHVVSEFCLQPFPTRLINKVNNKEFIY